MRLTSVQAGAGMEWARHSMPQIQASARQKVFMPQTTQPILAAQPTVWAFDFGLASLGEAVRSGDEFLHAASHLIPAEMAQRGPATSPGTPASLYRAMKTREAHRAREERLRAICAEAGIEVLAAKRVGPTFHGKSWQVVQPADPRLTREFPPSRGPDKDTCFTSCLLRIKLLQGELLAPWQVFKALHSAIQRRGYDATPAWINTRTAVRNEKHDEDTRSIPCAPTPTPVCASSRPVTSN